ncbi:unknown [Roseburia sp. CAG:309]|nr:unknown [Roseburia sp. CAG:309]
MPINSIDLVTLPSRSAEASTVAGREQHQIQHMADSGATIMEKEIVENQHRTVETKKGEKMNFDLGESGKSGYRQNRKKKRKKEETPEEKKKMPGSSFDVTI